MKYFLIGFAIWLVVAWLPHFIKSWINAFKFRMEAKRANSNNCWMYEL